MVLIMGPKTLGQMKQKKELVQNSAWNELMKITNFYPNSVPSSKEGRMVLHCVKAVRK